MTHQFKNLTWIHHASFRLEENGFVVYIDPWKVKDVSKKADLILITHTHFDHFDREAIGALSRGSAVVVGPADLAKELGDWVKVIKAGEKMTIGPAEIEAVPSYNLNKPNHPRENGWLGYVVNLGGEAVYHAGDADVIPEFSDVKCTIALLPIGGTYTMDKTDALEAVSKIKADYFIPMHYGAVVGGVEAGREFEALAKERGINKVVVLDPEEKLEN